MRIAVLALQGAFIEHEQRLSQLGVSSLEIRHKRDLDRSFDGLILPGGESTVQGKLLRELDLYDTLEHRIMAGLPVLGTCAGLLLLAQNIRNDTRTHFATMNITAVRNAYGRQLGSFHTEAEFEGIGTIPMTFIRAPYIEQTGDNAHPLAKVNGKIVAARQDKQLATAFHPELDSSLSLHRYFIDMIKE